MPRRCGGWLALVLALLTLGVLASPAAAQSAPTVPSPSPNGPTAGATAVPAPGAAVVPTVPLVPAVAGTPTPSPNSPGTTTGTSNNNAVSVDVNLPGVSDRPSQSILIIILLTLLSLAPSLVIMVTAFTRIVIVLSLTRNALGLQAIPPNQVITGLALFLSLFVMSPALTQAWDNGLKPFLDGKITNEKAFEETTAPIKKFMLAQTRSGELKTMIEASREDKPATPADVSLTTLIPAFILSELKTAFIIGFVIFIPFLVIDLVVSATLMSMGMMMLPPSLVSLPFKLLLFVMVDGWGLIITSLLTSFR